MNFISLAVILRFLIHLVNGTAAFMEVRVQSIVVEFILTHVDQLFGGAALSGQCPSHPPHHHSLPGESRQS